MSINTKCPVCDENVTLEDTVEVNELLRCACCQSQLVYLGGNDGGPALQQIETQDEDWGE